MTGRNMIETVMGAVVLAVAGIFLAFAYNHSSLRTVSGYEVSARFDRVDGVSAGTDVRISGIKIGTVIDQRLDTDRYLAIVRMSIDPRVKLPTDTVAEVASEGLLGGRYLALIPGGDTDMIKPGGEIKFTQSPVDLVQMLGKFMFSGPDQSKDAAKKP
ncbi:MAG: outer membrane lipid asymmetry maintenance protein MlaD [Rhodospirillaceae bacterium]|jgi:phospholipid/cholesterol/gamma-HCH transport system substrate-binding protein|nr:outer membrane lipid asymmetry maintenance protein MlaD [Rhodospirillaceae bacterium]